MSKKSEKLEIYMTEQKKQAIKTAAAEADMSVSSWLREAADRRLRAEQQDELLAATEAEQRIERLIDQATSEIAKAAEGMHEIQAKTGVYSIANWELLKTGFSDPKRQQALSTGSQRLRDDLVALGLDVPEPQPADDRDDGDTSARAERARDTEDSDDDRDDGSTTGLFDD